MSDTTISEVETVVYEVPFIRPHKLAMTTITTHTIVLVRIRSNTGVEGIGQSTVLGGPAYSQETPVGINHLINTAMVPLLLGRPATNRNALLGAIDKAVVGNRYAKAAVDMALTDLHARTLGISAAELLGGQRHDSFRLLWVLATGNADLDIAEAERKLDERLHDLFLVKVGRNEPKVDLARVARIKEALGERAELRVDVNQAWSPGVALRACRELAAIGVTVAEQPVHRDRPDALRELTRAGDLTVLADESVVSAADALALASTRDVDAFSLKLVKSGGISETLRIAAIADAAGIDLFGGGMIEPTLEVQASMAVFSTLPALTLDCQLFGPSLFADDITVDRPDMRDFRIYAPTGPGFGVEIDEDKLKQYTVKM